VKLPILEEAVDETLVPIRDRVVLVSGNHPEKVHMVHYYTVHYYLIYPDLNYPFDEKFLVCIQIHP
jgi:hypothetical protein